MSPISRRRFIATSAVSLSAGIASLHAIEPIRRIAPRIKGISLAAYSFRPKFDWFKGQPTDGSMTVPAFLDYCAEHGLDGAELTAYFFPEPVTSAYLNGLKRQAHILGLDITGGAIGNNLSFLPDSEEGIQQAAHIRHWIDIYAELGAPVIRIFAGAHGHPGATETEIRANIQANLSEALVHAEKRGVILAMENHDSMRDVDRLLEVVTSVDSEYFGICWDSGNVNPSADPYADLVRIAPYAVNAQIKVMIPVEGAKQPTDFKRLVSILRNANYGGYLVLEYEEPEDPFTEVPRYLAELASAL